MAEHNNKSFGRVSFKAISDEGIVEAIVSVFGTVDSYNERVMPGAFKNSLARNLPKCVWMHDWTKPIAKTLEARELEPGDPMLPPELALLGGLYMKWQFSREIDDSWQAYLKIKEGYVDEYSFGYRLLKWAENATDGARDLLEIELFEAGPVLVGANRATATLSVKQLSEGHVGLSLEDHTSAVLDAVEGLVKRYCNVAETREADGKLTDRFKSRLSELAGNLAGFAEVAPVPDAKADEALPPALMLEWEQMRHEAQLRALRG